MNTPLNVITLPLAQNNIIEASAGTGKTYTMVTLYLRLLLQAGENNFPTPLDIEQILVVTFTRDATRELRQRIRERTQSWLKLLESYQQNRDKSEIKDNELLALLPYLEDHLALAIQRLSFACEYIDKAGKRHEVEAECPVCNGEGFESKNTGRIIACPSATIILSNSKLHARDLQILFDAMENMGVYEAHIIAQAKDEIVLRIDENITVRLPCLLI